MPETLHFFRFPTRRYRALAGFFMAASLVACGGGGGGSSGVAGQGTDPDAVTQAMASGDARAVKTAAVMSATRQLLSSQETVYTQTKQALFSGVSGIDWNPTHDSSFFNVLDTVQNQPVLPSNWAYRYSEAGTSRTLAFTGTSVGGGGRYAAFGGNPLGEPGNAAMDQFMRNTVSWLTGRTSYANFKVVTAHLPGTETYWWPHESKVRTWFANQYPGVSINGIGTNPAVQADNRCDGNQLNTCLQGADLLVIGREQGPGAYVGTTVMQAVKDAQARGIPVLYLHHYRDTNDLASRMLEHFGAVTQSNNYWSTNGLKAFDPASVPTLPEYLVRVRALIDRLDSGTFTTDWSGCVTSFGRTDCSGDAAYMNEFHNTAEAIRTNLQTLDANSTALFGSSSYRLEKLLVLLGDKYRENVRYPMSRLTAGADFFRAYFSDMTVYMSRPYSTVAQNLGSFSGAISAATPALTRTITTPVPSSGSKEYMTGLYVMPGRTVTLTRTDAGSGVVRFGINMLRDTTRVFNTGSGTNNYDRPTGLRSQRPALQRNTPVTITSPFGGPLFLFMEAAVGAPAVTVEVAGVTTHPVLRDATDPGQVAAFNAEVASTPTNWVGIATEALTLHSTLAHFRTSVDNYANDLALFAADTWNYTIKDTYELAGFNAASGQLTLAPNVSDFCAAQGWDCTGLQHRRDEMQHVISDEHAACGNGCSGNPYDQDWAFYPLGWGETHEIGHNLQRARLKIYAGQSTEVSNNLFPVHKRMKFNQSVRGLSAPLVDRSGSTKAAFDAIKASMTGGATMYASTWTDTAYAANNSARVNFYRQLAEFARYYRWPASDGWELYTLLYLLERNFSASAASWASVAGTLGFGTYATYPSTMDGNDFMLIGSSRIIGKDMRQVFDMWGVSYSAAAAAQVAAYAYSPAEKYLFPMSHLSQIPAQVGVPVPMSGSALYPAGY